MHPVQHRSSSPWLAVSVVAVALVTSACGAEQSVPQAASVRADAGSGGVSTANITIDGHSESVLPSDGYVRVLLPPPSWILGGAYPERDTYSWGEFPVGQLSEAAPGAYSVLPNGPGGTSLGITGGTITDLAGNGQFAIGRWTGGTDSSGGLYNENQGRPWAVGTPVAADLQMHETRRCSLAAATRPMTGDGKIPAGLLNAADAEIKVEVDQGSHEARAQYTLHLNYSIGKDVAQNFVGRSAIGSLTASTVTRSTLMSRFVGSDPHAPFMIVSYGVQAPTAGMVNGIVVLQCPPAAAPAGKKASRRQS